MCVGIVIFGTFFSLLFIDKMVAIIVTLTIIASLIGIMFFWLGFKVLEGGKIPKEDDDSEKV